jgi:hypothetical protein
LVPLLILTLLMQTSALLPTILTLLPLTPKVQQAVLLI